MALIATINQGRQDSTIFAVEEPHGAHQGWADGPWIGCGRPHGHFAPVSAPLPP